MIKAKKNDIIKLFRTATTISLNDADGGVLSAGPANSGDIVYSKKDWAPLSNVLHSLSLSAAQAHNQTGTVLRRGIDHEVPLS